MPRSDASSTVGSDDADDRRARTRSRGATGPAPPWQGVAQAGAVVRDFAAQARAAAASVFAPAASAYSQAPGTSPFVPSSAPAPSTDAHAQQAGAGPRTAAPAAPPPPPQPSRPAPYSPAQTDWLRNVVSDAVGASIGSFASHVSAEFIAVREEISASRFEASEASVAAGHAKSQAAAAAAASSASAAQRDMEDLRATMDALSARVELLRTAEPQDERRVARIRGLGWDTSPDLLEQRAVALLAEAGIGRAAFGPVAAIMGRIGLGSAVETVFASRAAMDQARVALRGLRVIFDGDRAA